MSPPKIVISYWADVELAFIHFVQARCLALSMPFELHRISHDSSWFGPKRSILRNATHLVRSLIGTLRAGYGSNVCAFGTNVCRALFFFSWLFRRTHYIYNELPAHRSSSPLYWLDRAIFTHARFVYVSTEPRAQYVTELYGLTRAVGVVENIAFHDIPEYTEAERINAVVFAGSITPKRFSLQDIQKFRALRDALDACLVVYGVVARELSPEFALLLDRRGVLPHTELLRRLAGFQYALLAYYQDEPNYDLCAPLKLYEYVAAGCSVVSINRNTGLLKVAERYPNLIFFIDDSTSPPSYRNEQAFVQERKAFLQEALLSNEQLALEITA